MATSTRKFGPWLTAAACLFGAPTLIAADFQNLDFEQALVRPAPPNYVPFDAANPISASAAIPHWTAQEDSSFLTALWGAPVALDETSVALVGPGYNPLEGSYSINLYAMADAPDGYFKTASISQIGDVPDDARSIQLLVRGLGYIQATPEVTLNGTPISLIPQSAGSTAMTLAGDVTAFAGTTATLTIKAEATPGAPGIHDFENFFYLDSIAFSAEIVPEPASLNLMFLGGLALIVCMKCSQVV
jgi:hypothetical protein